MTEKDFIHREVHHGCGLLIRNESKTLFFVQQKDETYPLEQWRGACSFWGGKIEEEDETKLAAVERELEEEIPEVAQLIQHLEKRECSTHYIQLTEKGFYFTLFEVIVDDELIQQFVNTEVLEGRGLLLNKKALQAQKWLFGFDVALGDYF